MRRHQDGEKEVKFLFFFSFFYRIKLFLEVPISKEDLYGKKLNFGGSLPNFVDSFHDQQMNFRVDNVRLLNSFALIANLVNY